MSKVFISYRREDTADVCGRIYDRLEARFGKNNIFKDVDSIPGGVDFREHLRSAVGQCMVALVVIGANWLKIPDKESGQRRLDMFSDYVRIEVETALSRDISVIPLLVQGTIMPGPSQLPHSIEALAYRQAISVRSDPDFHRDMDRVIKRIDEIIKSDSLDVVGVREEIVVSTMTKKSFSTNNPTRFQNLLFERLEVIRQFLIAHPQIAIVPDHELAAFLQRPSYELIGFSIHLGAGNSKERIGATLLHSNGLPAYDVPTWNLNLTRFTKDIGEFIELYHNGDNSLPAKSKSYGKKAVYSITRYARQHFPELTPTDNDPFYGDKVYLGTIPKHGPITEANFRDVRRRLALYRYARWMWLQDHPLNQSLDQ